jgi:hypothetical protein
VEARYGKPLRVEGDQGRGTVCTYNFHRFHVVVTFLNGQSQSELYYRSDNKYLVSIEVLKLTQMNSRENYVWDSGNGMFVLVDIQRRGKPIAIAARFPDSRSPWSLHICSAEFVKKFGSTPSKINRGPAKINPDVNAERFLAGREERRA